jgi:hypothetical protein
MALSVLTGGGMAAESDAGRAAGQVASMPLALRAVGNQILNSNDEPVRLRGVNCASLEWTSDGEGRIAESVRVAIDDWHANTIRLPLSQDRWFGKAPGQSDEGKAYRGLVDRIVNLCASKGVYVMLDLHWSNAGVWGDQIGQHSMPDEHSVAFWKDLAPLYANHPAVLYDLYNEPHDVSWDVWLNGGEITDRPNRRGQTPRTYKAAGMQQLADAVRAAGARNLIVVGGLDWAYDFSGILDGRQIKDPDGNGVIYANHCYNNKNQAVETWIANMEKAAEKLPIIISEFGGAFYKPGETPPASPRGGGMRRDDGDWLLRILRAIEGHQWSYTAWDFHPAAGPTLIAGWDYAPTPHFGIYVKQMLSSRVVTYLAPAGEVLSTDYEVRAAGQEVAVYAARVLDPPFAGKEYDYGGPYSFANFDMSGTVTVRITSARSLANTVIRPRSAAVRMTVVDDHTLSLALDRPCKFSIEPDGKKGPLLLFANPLETDAPKKDDPGVVYFGPGVHKPEKIVLGSNQTLYIAGGAVVKAEVLAQGDNIRISGRGILDGSDWEWRKGPIGNLIAIRNSAGVEVRDITLRGSSHWTIVPAHSRNVTIRNVKLCNSRVQNDDGINPCNSQDVLITDCFIRSDDDCIALKGLDYDGANSNVERITVENCTLWCDRARIFLLGHESRAEFMRGITLRNLDIIHFSMTPFLLEPGEDMHLEDITIEDIRIHGEGQREFIRLRPVVNQYMRKQVPGFIRNVRFRNVALEGGPGEYLVQIEGADAEHGVSEVAFENVSILGEKLTEGSGRVKIGEHTKDIRFRQETPPVP